MNEYKSLITFGLMILLVIAMIVFIIIYDKKTKNGGADERQLLFQGKAYSYALFAMFFSNFLSYQAITIFEFNFHTEIFYLVSIMIAGVVFVISCIFSDSIITRIETKEVGFIVGFVWLLLIGKGIYNTTKSDAIENKILLIAEVFVLVSIIIAALIKCILNKKTSTEE